MSDRVLQILMLSTLLVLPVRVPCTAAGSETPDRPARQSRLEFPDDGYVPLGRGDRPRSPAYRRVSSHISTFQVNVDDQGRNILGDAANEPSIAIDPTDPD